jgi:small subunit ribosomal protein S6
MATQAPTYDLMLILDPQAQDDVRARIATETQTAIEGQGELVRHDNWGERPLSYPIDKRATGEYHLLQFRPSNVELLGSLDHTLRIADGVLRFRVIKLRHAPEGPVPVPPPPARRSDPRGAAPTASPGGESAGPPATPAPETTPPEVEPTAAAEPAAATEPPAEQPDADTAEQG